MRYFEDPYKTSENRLKQRSYYIPEGAASYTLLNGDWRFFYEKDGDSVDLNGKIKKWDKVKVPSTWQTTGYDFANYTNINYPFPIDPPYVPLINPVGIYEKDFTAESTKNQFYFILEGVATCASVYVNGNYVGYTQASHLQAEFDITEFVKEGKNTVRVAVRKRCSGSYLEDQDIFRLNGIFRDVYILERPVGHITDIDIKQENNDTIIIKTEKDTNIALYDSTNLIAGTKTDENGNALIKVSSPKLWNAEEPNLYTLEFRKAGEVIYQNFGFRTISISDKCEILINGTPVKLKGVNHHDSSEKDGWVMSDEQIIKDLCLMKELNINCIRTAHYPPSPRFLDYCDKMGFYVVLETDIEAHGMLMRDGSHMYTFDVFNDIWPCSNEMYKDEYLDRMSRAYNRDKNHSCIFMWSVGNESGFGPNTEKQVEFLRANDPSRLVHAEDLTRDWRRWADKVEHATKMLHLAKGRGTGIEEAQAELERIEGKLKEGKARHKKFVDVFSRMYPNLCNCERWAKEDSDVEQPIFHCEIAHNAGNGAGRIWEYTELLYKYPKFVGFGIWEWADLCITFDGVQRYGGDFEGELVNNENNCCDGVVLSNRKLKPLAYEIKAALAPFRFNYKDSTVTVENRHDFLNLSNFTLHYQLIADSNVFEEDSLVLDAKPHETVSFSTKKIFPECCTYGCFINVSLIDKSGRTVALLQQKIDVPLVRAEKISSPLILKEKEKEIIASGKNFKYTFDKLNGNLSSMIVNGKELLAEPVRVSAFRAASDSEHKNGIEDRWYLGNHFMWAGENLDAEFTRVADVKVDGNTVIFKNRVAGVARTPYFIYTLKISVFKDGTMSFTLDGNVKETCFVLPRLGFNFTFKKKNCAVKYFGAGPAANYGDSYHGCPVDWYESDAESEHIEFPYPQEHGNHINVRELILDNTLTFKAENTFQAHLSPYSEHQILHATHTDEIGESNASYLRIDYKVSGSSGILQSDKYSVPTYKLDEKEIHLAFTVEI